MFYNTISECLNNNLKQDKKREQMTNTSCDIISSLLEHVGLGGTWLSKVLIKKKKTNTTLRYQVIVVQHEKLIL